MYVHGISKYSCRYSTDTTCIKGIRQSTINIQFPIINVGQKLLSNHHLQPTNDILTPPIGIQYLHQNFPLYSSIASIVFNTVHLALFPKFILSRSSFPELTECRQRDKAGQFQNVQGPRRRVQRRSSLSRWNDVVCHNFTSDGIKGGGAGRRPARKIPRSRTAPGSLAFLLVSSRGRARPWSRSGARLQVHRCILRRAFGARFIVYIHT